MHTACGETARARGPAFAVSPHRGLNNSTRARGGHAIYKGRPKTRAWRSCTLVDAGEFQCICYAIPLCIWHPTSRYDGSGRGGIRTHGGFPHARFRVECLKPDSATLPLGRKNAERPTSNIEYRMQLSSRFGVQCWALKGCIEPIRLACPDVSGQTGLSFTRLKNVTI